MPKPKRWVPPSKRPPREDAAKRMVDDLMRHFHELVGKEARKLPQEQMDALVHYDKIILDAYQAGPSPEQIEAGMNPTAQHFLDLATAYMASAAARLALGLRAFDRSLAADAEEKGQK